jgi:fatty acid-binding protein DegV
VGAAEDLSEKYPDRKLYVCDGLCASMGGAILVHLAQKMHAAGKSIDEVRDWVEEKQAESHTPVHRRRSHVPETQRKDRLFG